MTADQVRIPREFNGPPAAGHGGYVCGVLAALWTSRNGGEAAVTLLAPVPLEVPLSVSDGGRRISVWQADRLVATVTAGGQSPPAPPPVSLVEAAAAERRFVGGEDHPFPTCFVCGPDRPDGMRLRPGQLAGQPGTVACCWTPAGDPGGEVAAELVWSALDCPSGWVEDPRDQPAVLSRMTARLVRPAVAGEPHVVVARRHHRHGRTATNHSALYDRAGRLVGCASALWTVLVPQRRGEPDERRPGMPTTEVTDAGVTP